MVLEAAKRRSVMIKMDQSDDNIQGKLRSLWHRERRLLHLRGACLALVLIFGLVLLDLVLDWLIVLPGWARLILLCFNLSALGWIAYRYWWQYLRSFDPLRMSLAVERLHPSLNSLLVSYLQLQSSGGGAPGASRELIAALRRQAVETAVPLDFSGVVDFRRLKKSALAAGLFLLLFGISGIFIGPFYRVLAIRMINPASVLGYPTRTQIEFVTGDLTVRKGDLLGLEIHVGMNSEIPVTSILEMRYPDGPWERLDVPGDKRAHFAYKLTRSTRSFDYRFRAGDAKTKRYTVDVVPPPQIIESLVTLIFPKYTGLEDQSFDILNFEVLQGSTIEWEIRCDQVLAGAQMVSDSGGDLDMKIDANDPQLARLSMPATNSMTYGFRWTELANGFIYDEGARRSLRVTVDEEPLVEVLPPKPSENATLSKSLSIRYRASDDFGLGEASIVYSLNGESEQEHALGKLTENIQVREINWKPAEWISGLKEGDSLVYAIMVSDNHQGGNGPNIGRSIPLKLNFLTREDYKKAIQQTRGDLFNRIKAIQEDEIESSTSLKQLKTEVKP